MFDTQDNRAFLLLLISIFLLTISNTLLNLQLDFDVITYPEEGIGVEILLNDLEGTTETCCMEGDMHARDQDHSREIHYFNFTTILAAWREICMQRRC